LRVKLGFVSAILPDLGLEEVLAFAREAGFDAVELMCWPKGKADRRYAGVTHIDVTGLEPRKMTGRVSALGYYPNPLCADEKEADVYINHLKRVISAAPQLGLDIVNTFVGRDHTRSVKDNWSLFQERWPGIVRHAEACGVRIAIENCPMLFTQDEWPGGKNLAASPKVWREMFERIPSRNFGLNYDPSHLVWQFMNPVKPIREFADRIFHVHAKDARVLRERLDEVGILATPLEYHEPKLPGLGDVPWPEFFTALREIGYQGAVCVELEDRAFEGSLENRKNGLKQAKMFLEQLI
jgi:sugar phosphate isomerase/epimerase